MISEEGSRLRRGKIIDFTTKCHSADPQRMTVANINNAQTESVGSSHDLSDS